MLCARRRYVAQVTLFRARPSRRLRRLSPERVDWLVAAVLFIAMEFNAWTSSNNHPRLAAALTVIVPAAGVALRRRWLLRDPADRHRRPTGGGSAVRIAHRRGRPCRWRRRAADQLRRRGVPAGTPRLAGAGDGPGAVHGQCDRRRLAAGGQPRVGCRGHRVSAVVLGRVTASAPRAGGRRARGRSCSTPARECTRGTAALGERARLAREIHDVIAHSVSVMVIQTAGARTVMDGEPDRAEAALRSVERAGREALAEMRRLLGVLGDGERAARAGAAAGARGSRRAGRAHRAAGLAASIRVEGEPVAGAAGAQPLRLPGRPGGADQRDQARRRRRAPRSRCAGAATRSSWRSSTTARGTTGESGIGGGHGIVGMRERTALHGGSVEAGPAPRRRVRRAGPDPADRRSDA